MVLLICSLSDNNPMCWFRLIKLLVFSQIIDPKVHEYLGEEENVIAQWNIYVVSVSICVNIMVSTYYGKSL